MNILIPFNFSLSSLSALRFGINLANETGSRIIVLHCGELHLPSYDLSYTVGGTSFTMYTEMVSKRFKKLLEELPITGEIEFEVQQAGLIDVAKEIIADDQVDLVIMGAGDSKGLTKTLFGNFTLEMMSATRIPVIAISSDFSDSNLKNICIAFDLSTENVEDLEMAKHLAVLHDARIHFLNVSDNPKEMDEEHSLDVLNLYDFFKGIDHEFHFLSSEDVDKTIDEFIKKNDINMLVLRPGNHWLFGKLFSHTRRALAHQKIPLMTIHK